MIVKASLENFHLIRNLNTESDNHHHDHQWKPAHVCKLHPWLCIHDAVC